MGEIKSALELALEKTEGVKSDKNLILKNKITDEGQKAAFAFLENQDAETGYLDSIIEKSSDSAGQEGATWVKDGMKKVLFSNLKLPENEASLSKIEKLNKAFMAICSSEGKKELPHVFQQVKELFDQYLHNKSGIEEKLKQNYAGKLAEKEATLSAQLGQEVHLNAENDPEYQKYLSKMYNDLDQQYADVLLKVRIEIEKRL